MSDIRVGKGAFLISFAAILFDLDGTLIQSEEMITTLWSSWARKHKRSVEEVLSFLPGRRMSDVIAHFLPSANLESEIRELSTLEALQTDGIFPQPGASDLLVQLQPSQWAIVTSAPRNCAESRMKLLSLPTPRVFITGDDVSKGKPHPEPYETAAKRIGVKPEECLTFEDAESGVLSAALAGSQVVIIGMHAKTVYSNLLQDKDHGLLVQRSVKGVLPNFTSVRIAESSKDGSIVDSF